MAKLKASTLIVFVLSLLAVSATADEVSELLQGPRYETQQLQLPQSDKLVEAYKNEQWEKVLQITADRPTEAASANEIFMLAEANFKLKNTQEAADQFMLVRNTSPKGSDLHTAAVERLSTIFVTHPYTIGLTYLLPDGSDGDVWPRLEEDFLIEEIRQEFRSEGSDVHQPYQLGQGVILRHSF
jgi:hypothetical protein